MASNIHNWDYEDFLIAQNIDSFNYITHIDNIPSILKLGILSRNELDNKGIESVKIDNPDVQKRRIENIPNIHYFVPIYIAKHTPMLYINCERKGLRNQIAILKIDLGILTRNGVSFSDMNCASADVKIYKDVSDLKELDWNAINRRLGWWPKHKKFKAAEVLVHGGVDPPEEISQIVIANQFALWKLNEVYLVYQDRKTGELFVEDDMGNRYPVIIDEDEFDFVRQ